MEDLRYPIGRFEAPAVITADMRKRFINDIRYLPSLVELAIQNLVSFFQTGKAITPVVA